MEHLGKGKWLSAMDNIQLEDLQAEIVRQRLNLHPAMVALHQPQADGWGSWTAGGVSAALMDMGIEPLEFCRCFGIVGLDAWLGPGLAQVSIPVEQQGPVTEWLEEQGWRRPWSWRGICRICSSRGIEESMVPGMFGLSWPDEWKGTVPPEEWDRIDHHLRSVGWSGP